MLKAIVFASALMIGGVALAQDAMPPADTTDTATAPADTTDTAAPPADDSATTYPPCSATVTDHCIQGQHRSSTHKKGKRGHH